MNYESATNTCSYNILGIVIRSKKNGYRKGQHTAVTVTAVTVMVTVKGHGWEGRDFAILNIVSLPNVLFHACVYMKLPLLPEEGRAVHPIQQAPKSPILFHFFNKRKALMLCRYPDFPRIFFHDVLWVFFFNMCNIVNEFFMNKLVLTN